MAMEPGHANKRPPAAIPSAVTCAANPRRPQRRARPAAAPEALYSQALHPVARNELVSGLEEGRARNQVVPPKLSAPSAAEGFATPEWADELEQALREAQAYAEGSAPQLAAEARLLQLLTPFISGAAHDA
jgi:hypothetical protein